MNSQPTSGVAWAADCYLSRVPSATSQRVSEQAGAVRHDGFDGPVAAGEPNVAAAARALCAERPVSGIPAYVDLDSLSVHQVDVSTCSNVVRSRDQHGNWIDFVQERHKPLRVDFVQAGTVPIDSRHSIYVGAHDAPRLQNALQRGSDGSYTCDMLYHTMSQIAQESPADYARRVEFAAE